MSQTSSSPIALHETEIRDHVADAIAALNARMDAHLAISRCGSNMGCNYCQLWTLSFAQIRRILDFLEMEIPKR